MITDPGGYDELMSRIDTLIEMIDGALAAEAERHMNERRDEMVERIHGEILSVYTDGYDHEVSDIVEHARRVITLVTKHRDAEIREALESEDVVSMFARMMWVQDDKPGVGPSSSYKMAARYNIDALKKAIGLAEEGGER